MIRAAMIALLISNFWRAPFPGPDEIPDEAAAKVWLDFPADVNGDISAIRLLDARAPRTRIMKAWIETDHAKNAKVKQRSSKALYRFDCQDEIYWIVSQTAYAADGEVLYSWSGVGTSQHVIPDSLGEAWWRTVCQPLAPSP